MKRIQNINDVIDHLSKNENYNHEIKGKRLKKQLKSLQEINFNGIKFKLFQITSVAISIVIDINGLIPANDNLILRLDREYPFNPPQIFYHSANQHQKFQYEYCKDLLGNILKDQIWGPSLTLPLFLQKLPNLAEDINRKQKLKWTYHLQFEYGRQELINSGIKLFQIQQYKWQYKILKIPKQKILGLTSNCFLKYQIQQNNENILKLDQWINIEDLKQIKVITNKKNYQLQINYNNDGKQQIMYLGGKPDDLNVILDNLNPISMIQRKVKNFQKNGVTDYDDAIQSYTALVEHYSLTDKTISDKYINSMKKLIESRYVANNNANGTEVPEIKT